jgi:hypothetical protein
LLKVALNTKNQSNQSLQEKLMLCFGMNLFPFFKVLFMFLYSFIYYI